MANALPGDYLAVCTAGAYGFVQASNYNSRPRPAEVLAATGFEPGAVAPFPASAVTRVLLEKELLLLETVWAGAGSSRHMVGLSPVDLARIARAEPTNLVELDEE